jgi:uncharacterized membrane protein YraQ (UPF0718 family)
MEIVTAILGALRMAFAMFWEILWALILGFLLSAVVQAVVSKSEMSRLLGDDSPKTLSIACSGLPLRLVPNHDCAATPSYINVIGFGPSI